MLAIILSALALGAASWLAWELRKVVAELLRLRAELDNRLVNMQAEVSSVELRSKTDSAGRFGAARAEFLEISEACRRRLDEHETQLLGIKAKFDAQKVAEKRPARWPRMS